MEILYYTFGWLFIALSILAIAGIVRPTSLRWLHTLLKRPSVSRKIILTTLLPAIFISAIGVTVTEPESIRAERLLREEQAHQESLRAAEASRLAEIERQREVAEKEARAKAEEEARLKAEKEAEQKAQQKKKREAAQRAKQEAAAKAAREQQAARERAAAQAPRPAPTPAPVYRQPSPAPRPAPAAPRSYVHPGSFCSPAGARGVFKSGNPAVCAIDSKGLRYRWQSP